jgi:hypothetical protein
MDRKILISSIATLIVIFISALSASAQEGQLTIVGNTQSVPDELTMKELKAVLRGERQKWSDGVSIKIALMKTNTPIGSLTAAKVYGMSGNELNKYFLALVFQGNIKAPVFFTSQSDLERYISENPGSIGVVQNSTESQIKIISVDGQKQIQ